MSRIIKHNEQTHEELKQTKLGSIPDKWEIAQLRDLDCEFISGGTPSRDNSDYFGGEIPWLKTSEVQNHLVGSSEEFLTKEGLKSSSAKIVPAGAVLVAMYGGGTVGNVALLEIDAATNQACCAVLTDETRLSNQFLYQQLLFENRRLVSYAAGSSQQNLSKSDVEQFDIRVPQIPEQRRIGDILSTVDEQIQQTDEIIEKTTELKRGLIQDLITHGIDHESYREELLGPKTVEIPDSWRVERMVDVAKIVSGSTPKKSNPNYWGGDIYWATPTDVTGTEGVYLSDTEEKITKTGLKNCSANLLEPGAVLMTSRATIGEAVINTVPVTTNQGFKSLVPGDDLHSEYLYYFVRTMADYLTEIGGGSTFPEINKSDTENIRVPVPPLAEQKQIVEIITSAEQKRLDEISHKENLQELKRGLMQDLLTGKVRVNAD